MGGHRILGPGVPVKEPRPEPDPPQKVVPIIFVPGIAGTNLRVCEGQEDLVKARLGLKKKEKIPHPWRPPNLGPGALLVVNHGYSDLWFNSMVPGWGFTLAFPDQVSSPNGSALFFP